MYEKTISNRRCAVKITKVVVRDSVTALLTITILVKERERFLELCELFLCVDLVWHVGT